MRDAALVIFMVLVLKIPVVYVGWVIWWAVRAENELGADGSSESPWKPWQRPSGSRSPRGGPHGSPAREAARARRPERKAA